MSAGTGMVPQLAVVQALSKGYNSAGLCDRGDQMNLRKRAWLVLFSIVSIAAIVLLASGVQSLDLTYKGQRLPTILTEEDDLGMADPGMATLDRWIQIFFAVAGALLPFAILLYLVSPAARKRLLRDFIALLILMVPLYFLWRAQPGTLGEIGTEVAVPEAAVEDLQEAPEAAFEPEPRQWLVTVATIGVALLGAALLVGLAWIIWGRRQPPATPLDELGQQAQDAIDAIEAGADLKDTVMRCYLEMMRVMKEERGIQRQQAMTPREFETRLEAAGIPMTQVRRLTRLFEQARYGDKQLSAQDERQAVISLSAIVRYCRSES